MKLICSASYCIPRFFFVRYTMYAVLVLCLLSLSGCVRLSGSAGYTKVKDDEVATKSTGFDLDSSRLVDQRGVS